MTASRGIAKPSPASAADLTVLVACDVAQVRGHR